MKKHSILNLVCMAFAVSITYSCADRQQPANEVTTAIVSPQELYGELFTDVFANDSLFGPGKLFSESKAFLDGTPKRDMKLILADYEKLADKHNTAVITKFLEDNFILHRSATVEFKDSSDIRTHIKKLWGVLRRKPDTLSVQSTLILLKHDYFVPGGRFDEVYYWDSYFSMLGMYLDGETELAQSIVDNFADLIDRIGFIPNGNRIYYGGRSQPPFFSHMIDDLAMNTGNDDVYMKYLPQLQKEYDFWMDGSDALDAQHTASLHCVRMSGGEVLNRYYDRYDRPREEMYRNDLETAEKLKASQPGLDTKKLFRDLRSGAESGWDFSSRWLRDYDNLYSIHTTDIVPVDLNSLLCHLEKTLAKAYRLNGENEKAEAYIDKAEKRKTAIKKYCWNEQEGYFMDYDFVLGEQTGNFSLAGVYPLFESIATDEQAMKVAEKIGKDFMKAGGVVTTLYDTGEQWDYPNGWAPLQWLTYVGLKNYGETELAATLRSRWMKTVENVYSHTYKLMEKYDVVNVSDTGGGEYPNQDGFGWTNGVYCAFAEQE